MTLLYLLVWAINLIVLPVLILLWVPDPSPNAYVGSNANTAGANEASLIAWA